MRNFYQDWFRSDRVRRGYRSDYAFAKYNKKVECRSLQQYEMDRGELKKRKRRNLPRMIRTKTTRIKKTRRLMNDDRLAFKPWSKEGRNICLRCYEGLIYGS